MRVLHLTTEFPPIIYGGLGTAVGGMVKASAQAGIETCVMLVGGGSGYGQTGGSTTTIFSCDFTDTLTMLLPLVQQWQPDVIHLHVFWLWWLAKGIREQTGIPLVYHVHSLDRAEYDYGEGPPECLTQWQVQQQAILESDRVIALSQHERQLLLEYCPAVTDRVRVVGNGIEPLSAEFDHQLNSAPMVLYSGRFVERKGVHELLAAIPLILEHVPDTQFVLAGGHRGCPGEEMARWWLPPDLDKWRKQIHFTGWLSPSEMADWYQKADILAVPSWYEPFGMVILEGMIHGVAIAATAVGGPAEILEDERTGLLCLPRDVASLAQILLRLIQDQPLRQYLSHNAEVEVAQKWQWPFLMKKMLAVYQEASIICPNLAVLARD
jgi:glycosyltransferase involved in cell wall biosynthesis